MWSDVYMYWKYLVGFFFYSILLVLPIYVNIDTLASSITGTTNQVLHMAYFYYVINTLWNGFFLYKGLNPYYLIFYLILITLFGLLNPNHILTTVTSIKNIFFISLVFMILLKFIRIELLTTLFIFVLTILSQMALYSFSYQPSFWLLGVIALYMIGYKLFLTNPAIRMPTIPPWFAAPFIAIAAFIMTLAQTIYNLTTLEKTCIFLFVSGILLYLYVRTITKSYYGGQLLVNDPISLDQNTTFPITPTYHSSLSCWFYLTPSTKGEYNTILLYGEQLLISYNPEANSLRIRLKDDISYIERKILLQKWNHLAFVYDHGKIILFLNGEVIHSSEWSPPSFTSELLLGKVQGKICNLRYYTEALDVRFVESLYENFKRRNPPIV